MKSAGVAAKTAKATSGPQAQKEKITNGPHIFADTDKFVEDILEKTTRVLLSQVKGETIKQYGDQLGSVVVDSIRMQLAAELKHNATIFKNTAFTEGSHAGSSHQPYRL